MNKCWVIFEDRYYSDAPHITAIFKTKKEAEKDCRNMIKRTLKLLEGE